MRLVLLGPPGAGKGTQGRRLAVEKGWPLISTGDILRDAVRRRTALGLQAQRQMDQGCLVGDDVMIGLVNERTAEPDAEKGYILDGFPRTVPQAAALDALLASRDQALDAVLYLNVADEELIARLAARREKESRVDDSAETVRKRLEVYYEQTEPVVEFYRGRNRLVELEGTGSIDDIYASLLKAVATAGARG